jgi:hypothetical protein
MKTLSELKQELNEQTKVGDKIIQQIKALDKNALMAYGARNYVSLKDGIQFDVKGSKHKGRIIIRLNSQDLYDIEAGTIRMFNYKVVKQVSDVSVENLVSVLDSIIG